LASGCVLLKSDLGDALISCASLSGTDIAIEADYVLMRSGIGDVLTALDSFHSSVLFSTPGTDIAIEAADYVLMKSDLGDVLTALDLSARTFRRIRLNYCWAFGYNTLMIPLAAGVLYPSTQWQMPPWVAGALQIYSPCLCDSQLRSMIPLTAGELYPSTQWQMPPRVAGTRLPHRFALLRVSPADLECVLPKICHSFS